MAQPLKRLRLKPTGFQLIQEIPIAVPPAKVWSSLANPAKWFNFDPTKPSPKTTFDLRPGGHWTTEFADGTAMLNATVTHVEPQKLLRMSGPLGLTHLPLTSVYIFELQPKQDGKSTLLRFAQRTHGLLTPDAKGKYTGGWKHLFAQLKAHAERR